MDVVERSTRVGVLTSCVCKRMCLGAGSNVGYVRTNGCKEEAIIKPVAYAAGAVGLGCSPLLGRLVGRGCKLTFYIIRIQMFMVNSDCYKCTGHAF